MKPLHILLFLLLTTYHSFSQSLDYISVQKKNGFPIKKFYSGSTILLQTVDGTYLEGPIKTIRNDSIFITMYDIRRYQTIYGSIIKDTISTQTLGLPVKEIKRIHLDEKRGFFLRQTAPIMMIGGAGYITLNVLNNAISGLSITEERNLRSLGIAAGVFGLGYLFSKIFYSDGFSKKKHKIVYVDL